MAQTLFNDILFQLNFDTGTSFATSDLNASGLKVATLFRARGDHGAITGIWVNFSSVTSPPRMWTGLQSSGTNVPSGTYLGSTKTTFTPAAGMTLITLASAYTPTMGDVIYGIIEYDSTDADTIDATHHSVVNFRTNGNPGNLAPCSGTFNGTTWTLSNNAAPAILAVQYADGYDQPMIFVANTQTGQAFNSGSSPDEYGIKFVAPASQTVDAIWLNTRLIAGASAKVQFYDGSDNILTGTDNITISGSADVTTNGSVGTIYVPITPITLTSGATYRITLQPQNANNCQLQIMTCAESGIVKGVMGDVALTSRTNAGAWTDDGTKFCGITPLVSAPPAATGGSSIFPQSKKIIIPPRVITKPKIVLITNTVTTPAPALLSVRKRLTTVTRYIRQRQAVIIQSQGPTTVLTPRRVLQPRIYSPVKRPPTVISTTVNQTTTNVFVSRRVIQSRVYVHPRRSPPVIATIVQPLVISLKRTVR